jgi:hypothetical protein
MRRMRASPRPAPPAAALALALAGALLPAACSRGPAQPRFVDALIAAAPEPAAGTYPTPERVVTRFFEAVNAGDPDAALRCFPVRAYHAAWDVETHFAQTGAWELAAPRAPVPPGVDELGRGLLAVLEYAQPYSRFRRLALGVSNPDATRLPVTRADPDWRARLDAVEALRISRSYEVAVEESREVPLDALDRAMKVEARKLLLLEVRLGGEPLTPKLAAVGRLGGNWRLLALVDR